jgi:uncharacterized phage-like protein YoqJ
LTILAGSGHRLGGVYHGRLKRELRHFAREKIVSLGATEIVSGMALGWDQAVALAAIDLQIPFVAVIPFYGMESKWQPDMRAEFDWIRERAKTEVEFSMDAYQKRNEFMVDYADGVMGLWDGRKHGGTFNCLRYAHEKGRRVHHLWQDWQSRVEALRAGWPPESQQWVQINPAKP